MIEFPKPIMKTAELVKMGFPEELLRRAYGDKNQTFASKINPAHANSPIVFDTHGFGIWWKNQVSAQVKAMPRGRRKVV